MYLPGTVNRYQLEGSAYGSGHQCQRSPLAPVPPHSAGQQRPRAGADQFQGRGRRTNVCRRLRLLAGDYLSAAVARQRSAAHGSRLPGQVTPGHRRQDHGGARCPSGRVVRSIHFDPDAWEDFLYWLGADRKMAKRITRLIGEIQRDPFTGIGKPEPLKGDLSGYWSRRIDDEHRLVYRADDKEVKILKARYHYGND